MIGAIDPKIFSFGNLGINWYGVIIASAITIALLLGIREGKKHGLESGLFIDLLIIGIPVSIISARIYYVIFQWSFYAANPAAIFKIWEGGLAIHGALIGAVITAYLFAKREKISFWRLADIAAPYLLLAQAIGRWGNFTNQEAYGGVVERSFLENLYLPDFIIEQMYIREQYHHPTFLYESLWNLLGVVLLVVFRRRNPRLGETFLAYLAWYSLGRFFIEGLRVDSLQFFGLRTAQVLSIVLFVGSLILIYYRRKKFNQNYLEAENIDNAQAAEELESTDKVKAVEELELPDEVKVTEEVEPPDEAAIEEVESSNEAVIAKKLESDDDNDDDKKTGEEESN